MITANELRDFFVAHGARIVHAGDQLDRIHVVRFAHYEDAAPGSITWARHPLRSSYPGTVLFLRGPYHFPQLPTQLLVFHPRMRALVTKTLEKFAGPPTLKIDEDAITHPTTTLGGEAQNYEWIDGTWRLIPAAGGVRIANDVEVGAYSTIVRGTTGDTTIGKGCRIGRYVNVGHDVRIGSHTLVIAHASIAGWARIGSRCKIYQGALIKNGVTVGDAATIGMGAVVTTDVGPGEIWAGNPAHCIGRVEP